MKTSASTIQFPRLSTMTSAFMVILAMAAAGDLVAQDKRASEDDKAASELEALKARVAQLEERDKAREAEETERFRRVRVFGDIGFRFHHISSSGASSKAAEGVEENRLEGLLRLGATGYLFDTDKHRMRYEARFSLIGQGDFTGPLGAPTVGWRPVDGFGTGSPVMVDRLLIEHTYKKWLRIEGGRFAPPFRGSQAIFDQDLSLTGLHIGLDIGRFTGIEGLKGFDTWRDYDRAERSQVSRLHIHGAGYVFAEDEYGLPVQDSTRTPAGASLQVSGKYRFVGTDSSISASLGAHWFNQAGAVSRNLSTGTTFTTTNITNAAGLVPGKFHLVDLFFEGMLLEEQAASLRIYMHAIHNLGRSDSPLGFGEDASGVVLGLEWGTLEFEEASTFRLSYHYYYLEPDAAISEFNLDAVNTNFKGHYLGIKVAVRADVLPFADFYYGERVDDGVGGFGVRNNGTHGNPSDDKLFRVRLGVLIQF